MALLMGLPAWLGGSWLYLHYQQDPKLGLALSREEAITKAVSEATVRGFNVGEWEPYVHFEAQRELVRFKSAENDHLPVPTALIFVKFHSLEKNQSFEVILDPHGNPLGYLHLAGRPILMEPRE
ncbi:MAG: hypothetical protein ACKOB4_10050, partial [Acidobacteriota bacterium]